MVLLLNRLLLFAYIRAAVLAVIDPTIHPGRIRGQLLYSLYCVGNIKKMYKSNVLLWDNFDLVDGSELGKITSQI